MEGVCKGECMGRNPGDEPAVAGEGRSSINKINKYKENLLPPQWGRHTPTPIKERRKEQGSEKMKV